MQTSEKLLREIIDYMKNNIAQDIYINSSIKYSDADNTDDKIFELELICTEPEQLAIIKNIDEIVKKYDKTASFSNVSDNIWRAKINLGEDYMKKIQEELFVNDNGLEYDVVERNSVGDALLHRVDDKGLTPWVVAFNCPVGATSWGQGHYFTNEKNARDYWNENYVNKINESKETLVEKQVDYDDYEEIIDEPFELVKRDGRMVKSFKLFDDDCLDIVLSDIKLYRHGVDIITDDVFVSVDYGLGSEKYEVYFIDYYFAVGAKNEEELLKILQNPKDVIEHREDEDRKYAEENLPTLWKMFKNGSWKEGEYISDFFSDVYKDVFNHRPRTENQIVSEISQLASEYNIKL